MGLDMEIYGDFHLSVGSKIGIIIPKPNDSASMSGTQKPVDKYIGGSYIVTSISHFFSPSDYRCSVGLQKDSLGFDLDSEITIGKSNKLTSKTNQQTKPQRRKRKRSVGSRILGKL